MKTKNLLYTFLILLMMCCYSKSIPTNDMRVGYNLASPNQTFILPEILHEISGLTYIDSVSFACIQDENGKLFIYNVETQQLQNEYTFHLDGDYEGITRVEKTIYVLRSDGGLFEISDYQDTGFTLTTHETGIPANNNEGLCYDPEQNRLLIAAKGKLDKSPENKDRRVIYGFDLKTKRLSPSPVFEFNLQSIKEYAVTNNIELASKFKKNGKDAGPMIRFMTSAIGIHPITHNLYLLSAADHMLFVFDMQGNIKHIEQLNADIFNKAEGLTFFENGDMLITNEGQNKKPTLLRFNYQTKNDTCRD